MIVRVTVNMLRLLRTCTPQRDATEPTPNTHACPEGKAGSDQSRRLDQKAHVQVTACRFPRPRRR